MIAATASPCDNTRTVFTPSLGSRWMLKTLGQYQLLAPIASGGMAEVWLARRMGEAGFARDVVIKRMHPRLTHDERFVRMFLDEARLTAALQHPNIAQVLDLGRVDDDWFIAMEFVDGPDLARASMHAIRSKAGVPVSLAAWVVARAAEGLHHAHQQCDPMTGLPLELVHRDVSHANILLSRHGDVKVIDFGIASANVRESSTRAGVVKGKPGYLAPEQLQGLPQDGRVDVFALGVVLWELLTGQVLFRRAEHVVSMARTLDYYPPAPSSIRPTVSPDIDSVVLAALEKDPADRIASAALLASCLDACVSRDPSGLASRAGLARWVAASPVWPPDALKPILARRQGTSTSATGAAPESAPPAGRLHRRTRSPVPPPLPARPGSSAVEAPRRPRATMPRVPPDLAPVTTAAAHVPWEEATPIRRDNLVHNRDRFIGRIPQLQALTSALAAGDRLVTLTGPPGVGKSRLADAFARRQAQFFAAAGGTWRCSLAACASLEDACRVVAEAIDLPLGNASTTSAAVDQIGGALAGRGATLLWLDDVGVLREQMADAVGRWLAASATLVVVATARRALGVVAETAVAVPPLSLDGGVESEAGQLLLARVPNSARGAVKASPGRVAAIVATLDGLPLAIELAAGRLGEVDTEGLLRELSPAATVAGPGPSTGAAPSARRGATPDAGSSAASVAASPGAPPGASPAAPAPLDAQPFVALDTAMRVAWSQLQPWQLAALVQLNVMRGGVDVESAAAILDLTAHADAPPAAEVLSQLLARSLLRTLPTSEGAAPRLAMHDSVRAWLLGAGQPADSAPSFAAAERRRATWGLRLAERCATAARSHDGARARARLGLELDNLLPIHAEALRRGGGTDVATALRLSSALLPLLLDRGPLVVLARLLDDAVAAADALEDGAPTATALARALADRAEVRVRAGLPTEGLADAERALALAVAADDPRLQATAQLRLGNCHRRLDHATRAMRAAVQARLLGQQIADLPIETEAMHLFGCVYYDLGDRAPARRCFETSLRGAQQIGDRHLAARARANLGCIQADLAELDAAESSFAHALADERALGNLRGMAVDTCYLALVAQERGDFDRADNLYQRAVDRLDEVGDTFRKAYVAGFRGWNQLERGDIDAAEETLATTTAFFLDKGDRKLRAMHMAALGLCHGLQGDAVAATEDLDRATHVASAGSDPVPQMVVSLLRAANDRVAARALPPEDADVVDALVSLRKAEAHAERPGDGPYAQGRPPLAEVSSEVRFALRVLERCGAS